MTDAISQGPSLALDEQIQSWVADGYELIKQGLVLGLPEGFAIMLTPKKTRYVGISDRGEISGEYSDRTAVVNWCRHKWDLRQDDGLNQLIQNGSGRPSKR